MVKWYIFLHGGVGWLECNQILGGYRYWAKNPSEIDFFGKWVKFVAAWAILVIFKIYALKS